MSGHHHPEFVDGTARYLADRIPSDALAAWIVRSPAAHGHIRDVDRSAALAMDGVVDVLTAADLGPAVPRVPIRSFSSPDLEAIRQPVLADSTVRYVGEPVAVVVATDRGTAREAARRVSVTVDPLPPVTDPRTAPEVCRIQAGTGDAAGAFATAHTVVERRLRSERHTGLPMETRGLAARWTGDTVELWGPTKFVDHTTVAVADWFGVGRRDVTVHPVAVGGMFGVRGELYPEDFLVPWLARRTGRTVAWIEDRREHLAAINHAPELDAVVAMALDGGGRLAALRARITVDLGAYPRGNGNRLVMLAIEELLGPYHWDAIDVTAVGVRTTLTPTGSVRAPVAAESTFFRETVLDALAAAAGQDAGQVRRSSLVPADRMPYRRQLGPQLHPPLYDGGDYPAFFDLIDADRTRLAVASAHRRRQGLIAGTGTALFLAHSAVAARESVELRLHAGTVTVRTSLSDVGQGIDRVIRTVLAAELGLPEDRVRVDSGRPSVDGRGRGTFSSRSTVVAANACRQAAAALCDQVRRALTADPGGGHEQVVTVPGGFEVSGRFIGWTDVGDHLARGEHDDPEPLLGIGGHVAAVTVDPVTGRVDVLDLAVAYDCGAAIDREGVVGQLTGGSAHGLGIALTEALRYDGSGTPTGDTLLQYRVPTARDVPAVAVRVVESGTARNAFGAKGAGEAGVVGVPAAIAGAVRDALLRAGLDPAEATALDHLPIREPVVRRLCRRTPSAGHPSAR